MEEGGSPKEMAVHLTYARRAELGDALRRRDAASGPARLAALDRGIDPTSRSSPHAVCQFTGLRVLIVGGSSGTPGIRRTEHAGRKVWFLVRDRRTPNHPILGHSLGSSVCSFSLGSAGLGGDRRILEHLSSKADSRLGALA